MIFFFFLIVTGMSLYLLLDRAMVVSTLLARIHLFGWNKGGGVKVWECHIEV